MPPLALARAEVLLAAGAVGTPALLQRSGIGPVAALQRHGIEVRHSLAGLGENLQDHLQIRAVFGVEGVRTLNTLAYSPWGKAATALEYLLRRSGPMSMAPSQLGAFTRSSPAHAWPKLECHVQPLSLDAIGEPLHRFDALTASVCNLNPTSRGRVQIRSPRADDAPRIEPNYLSTPEDRQVAADSLRLTRRIAAMPALARYRPREIRPGVEFQRADDPLAVVDNRLRVRGVAELRVIDAGVMPTITSGNTNAPTPMIAERAAQWIAEADAPR